MKKLHKQLKEYKDIEVPYHVWRFMGDKYKFISLAGNMASLGEDFGTLEQLRTCLDWYADQLGGKIKWED